MSTYLTIKEEEKLYSIIEILTKFKETTKEKLSTQTINDITYLETIVMEEIENNEQESVDLSYSEAKDNDDITSIFDFLRTDFLEILLDYPKGDVHNTLKKCLDILTN